MGGVVVFVLLLVAAVSALVAGVAWSQLQGGRFAVLESSPEQQPFLDPVTVQAEVLDVDGDAPDHGGWVGVDVRFRTPDGGTEVAFVDLGGRTDEVPRVGETIEVVHERDDPDWVLAADDPMLTGRTADGTEVGVDDGVEETDTAVTEGRAAAEALVRRTVVLSGAALLGALAAGALTLVAVRRAPQPQPARWEG